MDIWFTLFVLVISSLAAVGVSLALISLINALVSSVAYGWRWLLLSLLLPVLGSLIFCYIHRKEQRKTGFQLAAAVLCLSLATGGLYGLGPSVIQYLARNLQAEAGR